MNEKNVFANFQRPISETAVYPPNSKPTSISQSTKKNDTFEQKAAQEVVSTGLCLAKNELLQLSQNSSFAAWQVGLADLLITELSNAFENYSQGLLKPLIEPLKEKLIAYVNQEIPILDAEVVRYIESRSLFSVAFLSQKVHACLGAVPAEATATVEKFYVQHLPEAKTDNNAALLDGPKTDLSPRVVSLLTTKLTDELKVLVADKKIALEEEAILTIVKGLTEKTLGKLPQLIQQEITSEETVGVKNLQGFFKKINCFSPAKALVQPVVAPAIKNVVIQANSPLGRSIVKSKTK